MKSWHSTGFLSSVFRIHSWLKSRHDNNKKNTFLLCAPSLAQTWPADSAIIPLPSFKWKKIPLNAKYHNTGYNSHSVWNGRWFTKDKWMCVVASWSLPPPMMKRAGPLCRSQYHVEYSSMEDMMQAIRVLGVAWFNARLLFAYAGIRDCFLQCQGWLALGGGWLGFP